VDVEVGNTISVSMGMGLSGFKDEFGLVKIMKNTIPMQTALSRTSTVKIFHTKADVLLDGAFWASA
jgi:hypothetical protein